MKGWFHSITTPAPEGKMLAVSDGVTWGRGRRLRSGRWEADDDLVVKYWMDVQPPPPESYQAADGSLIISLHFTAADIHITAQSGDELWTSTSTEPVLTFLDLYESVVTYKPLKIKNYLIADWEYFRSYLMRLGWNTCYLRRPIQ